MKHLKIIIICLLLLFSQSVLSKRVDAIEGSLSEEIVSVNYKDFTSLPSDWSLLNGCDKNNTSISFDNNEMVITNRGTTSSSVYYGSVYHIGSDADWQDFTFEITMKMTSAEDSNRWFGIGYHTQEIAGDTIGYLLNYRNNGDSAFSAFNSAKSFYDGDRVNKQNVKLSDGNYHTVKIVMNGYKSSHYIDDKLIIEWDVRDRDTHLGGSSLTYGGFLLFVNRSTIRVKEISISGTKTTVQNVIKDESIVDTYQLDDSLINFPTVVADVCDLNTLESLTTKDMRPSNAILHVNDNLEVEFDGFTSDLNSVIDTYLKKQVIPVIYLANETQANNFIKMCDSKLVIDMAVMASDPSLIKMVKERYPVIRGIYHVKAYNELIDIVHNANICGAMVTALDENLVSKKVVDYLQARFKTVWVVQSDESEFNLHNSINSGCYGMIVKDYLKLYETYYEYDENTILRSSYNVAHRGLSSICNENSIHGAEEAIESGATHIETDIYLTKDNQLVLMHDNTIDRTSSGTGQVENYTLAQLQQFKLDRFAPNEVIPSLDDLINVMNETDVVLVLEIKSSKLEIVSVLADKLKELDFMDQVVIISFNTSILAEVKDKLPEIPTANLNEARTNNMASVLYWMGMFNTGIDANHSNISVSDDKHILKDRGIMGWYWTYDPISLITNAIKNNVTGITNNNCNYFYDFAYEIEGVSFTLDQDVTLENQDFEATVTYYGGYEEVVTADLAWYVDRGDYYEVICKSELFVANDIVTMYTPKFIVNKTIINDTELEKPSQSNGCGGQVFISLLSVIVLGGFVTVLKKKKEFN